jgi:hypothetical protein
MTKSTPPVFEAAALLSLTPATQFNSQNFEAIPHRQ